MSDVFVGGFRTQTTGEQTVATYLWDTGSLAWVPQTASTGTGGAVNVTNTYLPVSQYGTWNTNSTITSALPAGTNFLGNVSITSMPAISVGSVSVSNFPSTQAVTGAFYQATQPVSISSTVSTTDTHTTAAAPISVRLTDGSAFYTASGGGGGGGNAAASATGAAVPTSADYSGWNNAGNLVGTSLTSALPIQPGTGAVFPVTGSFYQATQPVSISSMPSTPVTGTFWQTTQPVSIATMPTTPVTGTFYQATQPVSVASTISVSDAGNATSAVASVSASITTVTLKAANSARKGLAINNDSASVLYLKLGATASTASYTVKMAANSYFECPYNYTGVVDGIWVSATGSALVTEVS